MSNPQHYSSCSRSMCPRLLPDLSQGSCYMQEHLLKTKREGSRRKWRREERKGEKKDRDEGEGGRKREKERVGEEREEKEGERERREGWEWREEFSLFWDNHKYYCIKNFTTSQNKQDIVPLHIPSVLETVITVYRRKCNSIY